MAVAAALLFASPAIQSNQVYRVGESALIQQDRHSAEPPTKAQRALPAPDGCAVEIHEIPALQIVFAKVSRRARDGPAAASA